VPWLTGHDWRRIDAARAWGALPQFPHFRGCAQVMATLANGAGVLADFSYLAPNRLGYDLPHYWHVLVHGTLGLAETHLRASRVDVITADATVPESRGVGEAQPRRYLTDFANELRGSPGLCDLTSAQCLRASRLALEGQWLADGVSTRKGGAHTEE
jgi:hypothetical protein